MSVLGQADGALSQAAGHVAASRSRLTGLQRELDSRLHDLAGRWAGQGARAFGGLQAAWQERQTRITTALDDFERSLIDTERDNEVADAAAALVAARLTARMG